MLYKQYKDYDVSIISIKKPQLLLWAMLHNYKNLILFVIMFIIIKLQKTFIQELKPYQISSQIAIQSSWTKENINRRVNNEHKGKMNTELFQNALKICCTIMLYPSYL